MCSELLNNLKHHFPRAKNYRTPNQDLAIYEASNPFQYFPYREHHLQCLWADPKLRPTKLKTSRGESIEVEHPGDWNLESGPDFLNATLLIGKERRRICGDIEIHIHPNGWKLHNHANDPRYSNVRFHIVYFQGKEIPHLLQIPLQKVLNTDPCFSFENIDTTAYPYSIPSGNFPLQKTPIDQKIEWLESAGEERLRLKSKRFIFAMQTKEPTQLLWEELMSSLGYKNNKTPFRKLASHLPIAQLRSISTTPEKTYAILLGLSGFLPLNMNPEWDVNTRSFIRLIWDLWWKQSEEIKELTLKKSEWELANIRPINHPIRRLMAAAYYASRIPNIIADNQQLNSFPENYWSTHINWKTQCKPTALVGQSRANAIVTNVLVPYRAAAKRTDLELEKLPPEPLNSIIHKTAYVLFGPDHTPKIYKTALARQGLIQVFHDYLIPRQLNKISIN